MTPVQRATPAAAPTPPDAERQLKGFIDKFEPAHRTLIRAVRAAMRERYPAANELVYDNYNFFVIGYSPNERPSDAIFSVAADANGVRLCFLQGASLADPTRSLLGSGKVNRYVPLASADALARPELDALMAAAVAAAAPPLPSRGRGKIVIKSVSAKQRPRRKAARRG